MAKISDSVGKSFEESIGNKLRVLQQLRVVSWWEHQQPELYSLGVVKRGPRMVPAFGKGKPSGADFAGFLAGGQAFALEAKSVAEGSSLVLEDDTHFSPKQRDHLQAARAAGAASFLAVQFRRTAAPWLIAVIPWADVPWEKAQKHHHLRAEAAELWRLPTDAHLFEHMVTVPLPF